MIRSLADICYRILGWIATAQEVSRPLPPEKPPGKEDRYDALKQQVSSSVAAGQFADAQRYLQQAIALRQSSNDLLLSVNLDMRTKEYDHALATAQRVQAMHVASLWF